MMMMVVMTFERKANSYMMTQPSLFPFASNNVGVPVGAGFRRPPPGLHHLVLPDVGVTSYIELLEPFIPRLADFRFFSRAA